jgi:hypothetical protein
LKNHFFNFCCDKKGQKVILFLFDSLLSSYFSSSDSGSNSISIQSLTSSTKPKLDGIRLFYNELLLKFDKLSLDPLGNIVFQKFIGFLF